MNQSLLRKLAAAGLLLALPLALRLVPIRHGMPRNYIPDTHMVRQALSMARDRDLVPEAGKYSFYPNLLPYLLLPCYAAEYGLGKARGDWQSSREFGDHLLDHPEDAALVARLLVALFGALTPLVVFQTARAAGLRSGAWVAGFLAATSLLCVHLSTHERPWMPLTFFMALSAWPAARYARSGRGPALLYSGTAAALAAACHQGGLAALAIPGFAWLFGPLEWKRRDRLLRLRQGAGCILVFAVVALAFGYPHFVLHGFAVAGVAGGQKMLEAEGGVHVSGLSIVFDLRWESLVRLAGAVFGYDPVVVLLGMGGLALGLGRRELRAPLAFALAWAAFFMTNRSDHVRYLVPVVVFLCWPAGLLAEELVARRWGKVLLLAALALPLVQSTRLAWLLTRPDTRADAEARLSGLEKGAVVAIDRYGPEVDLDRAGLARLERVRVSRGEPLRLREDRRRLRFGAGSVAPGEEGVDAVRIEELFEIDERTGRISVREGLEALGQEPREVLLALGVTHFLRVDRCPAEERGDLALGGRVVLVIDPALGIGPPREAYLPTEMRFALTGLWQVSRPGPWLALQDLR